MTIKGVTQDELNIIKNILTQYKDRYEFFIYGSRVKGNFRFLSDLDVLIKGENQVNSDDLDDLKTRFDNSDLPYVVNFTDFNNIDDEFFNLIKDELVKI